ncbi:InlB B-repeat-containing protein [Phocaeicola sp.]
MINIKTKEIPHKFRNKYLKNAGGSINISGSANSYNSGNSLPSVSGNYLPSDKDGRARGIIDFTKGLKLVGVLITRILQINTEGDPTDNDIMSAARILNEISSNNDKLKELFLSKITDDEAAGLLKFLSGSEFGKFVSERSGGKIDKNGVAELFSLFLRGTLSVDDIRSKNFQSGALGTGMTINTDPVTGQSYMEVDKLFVRMKAFFTELVIQTLSHVGGQIVLSPARMKCIDVKEMANAYRCYFNTTDGEKTITNDFVIGDQARAQSFNITTGTTQNASNTYYWRLVVGKGENYIDLSKSDCDKGSDAPSAGDDICQLGNRTDATRQCAIILSAYGDDAPSIKQYSGIASYSLSGKAHTVFSSKGNKITGELILESGKTVDEALGDLDSVFSDLLFGYSEYIETTFRDGVISSSEAGVIRSYQNQIDSTFKQIDGTYNEMLNNELLSGTQQKTNLMFSYNSVKSAYGSLQDAIAAAIEDGVTTPEEKENVDTKFTSFNASLNTFCKAAEGAKRKIDNLLREYSDGVLSELNTFVEETFKNTVGDLSKQIDGKVETWFQVDDPSKTWKGAASLHEGDIWFNSTTKKLKIYRISNNGGVITSFWDVIEDQKTIDAYNNASQAIQSADNAQKTADKKRTIFTSSFAPNPPYLIGDLWTQGVNGTGDLMVCCISRAEGTVSGSGDWKKATKYTDDTTANEALDKVKKVQASLDNIPTEVKDSIAQNLGYTSYSDLKAKAEAGKSILKGGYINTVLLEAEAIVTAQLIADAIAANSLNVNNKFKIYKDGSADISGILHSIGSNTEVLLSDGYIRVLYKGTDMLRISINEASGSPEINMNYGNNTAFLSPTQLTFSNKGGTLTLDPTQIGSGVIMKRSDGTLFVKDNQYNYVTVQMGVSPAGTGTVTPFVGSALKIQGATEQVSATPANGYQFERWSDGGAQTHTVIWNQGTNLIAYFKEIVVEKATVTLSALPPAGGTVTGGGTKTIGSTGTIEAIANPGYRFIQWSKGVGSELTKAKRVITWTKNESYIARFDAVSITGSQLFIGTELTNSTYTSLLSGVATVNVASGKIRLSFSSATISNEESPYITFNKGQLGGKMELGHIYQLKATVKITGSVMLLMSLGLADKLMSDVNGDGIIYEEVNNTTKTLTLDITATRASTVNDALCILTAPTAPSDTVEISDLSLKEI